MKKLLALLTMLVVLTFCTPAHAWENEPFSADDVIKEATFLGLLYLERAQRDYAQEHGGMYMPNPFLGPNRKDSDVDKFLIATAILHPIISRALSGTWRDWWQYGTIIIEATSIGSNMALGVGFHF